MKYKTVLLIWKGFFYLWCSSLDEMRSCYLVHLMILHMYLFTIHFHSDGTTDIARTFWFEYKKKPPQNLRVSIKSVLCLLNQINRHALSTVKDFFPWKAAYYLSVLQIWTVFPSTSDEQCFHIGKFCVMKYGSKFLGICQDFPKSSKFLWINWFQHKLAMFPKMAWKKPTTGISNFWKPMTMNNFDKSSNHQTHHWHARLDIYHIFLSLQDQYTRVLMGLIDLSDTVFRTDIYGELVYCVPFSQFDNSSVLCQF